MIRSKFVDERIKDILYGMKSDVGIVDSDIYFLIDQIQKYEEWLEQKDENLQMILSESTNTPNGALLFKNSFLMIATWAREALDFTKEKLK